MKRDAGSISIQARFTVRDFFLLLSLLGVGSNMYWCWTHDREIKQLREQHQTQITELKK